MIINNQNKQKEESRVSVQNFFEREISYQGRSPIKG